VTTTAVAKDRTIAPGLPGIAGHLIDFLVMAVCAVIVCAESWVDIALHGRSKLVRLRALFELPNDIPRTTLFGAYPC